MAKNAPKPGALRFEPIEIARLEERRQSHGVAMIADESVPAMGGMLCSGPSGSWLNRARGIGLGGGVSEDEIDEMVAFYRARGHPPAVEMCPYVDASLVRGLQRRGFAITEFLTCWAFGLDDPDLNAAPSLPDGIAMRLVDPLDAGAVEAWATLLSDGFNDQGSQKHRDDIAAMSSVARQEGVFCVGAFDEDVLVGASAAEVSRPTGGRAVAGLFSASVCETHQRRGIQAGMILERLRIAQARGASVACIESKPGIATERNALRVGFFPAYTKVTVEQHQALG